MGADQVAAIRPMIVELEDDERELPVGAPARHVATFSVPPAGEPWVEVYLESESVVTMAFPFEDDPLARLQASSIELLPGNRVTEWEPGVFCTLALPRVQSMVLARFIDILFTNVFQCGEDYPVDVEVARLPAPPE